MVFPAPFSPSRPINSPCSILSDRLLKTGGKFTLYEKLRELISKRGIPFDAVKKHPQFSPGTIRLTGNA
ncbi:hypothetical protein, partial [Klebsiella pneumoniae]|uniref:hypothetical protein n=1 Tax=Klebsiella pneumoniae TaxID=573 RepID=UPI001D0D7042